MPLNNLSLHFLEKHPRESAKALQGFAAEELAGYLSEIPEHVAANILSCLVTPEAVTCLVNMEVVKAGGILERMGTDAAARLLRSMQEKERARMINCVTPGYAYRLKSVLRYPSGTVGQYMSPNIFVVSENMLAGEVLDAARNATSELQSEIFIVNDKQHIAGMLDVRTLIAGNPAEEIRQLMVPPEFVLNARTNIAYIKDHPAWQRSTALPVIDHKNVFVGVLKKEVIDEILNKDYGLSQQETGFLENLMIVMETLWEIYAGLINPGYESERKGESNGNR